LGDLEYFQARKQELKSKYPEDNNQAAMLKNLAEMEAKPGIHHAHPSDTHVYIMSKPLKLTFVNCDHRPVREDEEE